MDVQYLGLAGIQQLEDFYFEQTQFAVGDDEEIAAAARRVQEAQCRDLFMESPELGFAPFGTLEFRAQVIEEE